MAVKQGVVIAGGGIPGLALAIALKRALGDRLDVTVCDPMVHDPRHSHRATAIAPGPRRMLETLGIWQLIATRAQPIQNMIITDSKLTDFVRPTYLQFGGDAGSGDALAHMVEDDDLKAALLSAAKTRSVDFVAKPITDARFLPGSVELEIEGGDTLTGSLLVAADGGKSKLRSRARVPTIGWSYKQSGIVATLSHGNPHNGQAEEHFLPDGPFAVLPLVDNRISIVWSLPSAKAGAAIALADAEFVALVQARMGQHLGEMRLEVRPRAFPLALQLARNLVAPRLALVGDAAHVIHPIAGQGLNLGLRDVAALAGMLCHQIRLGLDIGTPDGLDLYQRQRRFDTLTMAATTDILNRMFSNDSAPLRMLRDFGLGLVDRAPMIKGFLTGEAARLQGMETGQTTDWP